MAEQAVEAAPEAKATGAGKKKLILILAAVALLGGGGGAGYYFLVKKPASEKVASAGKGAGAPGEHGAAAAEEAAKAEEHSAVPPATLTLEIFTANIQPIEAEKYLQLGLVLKIKPGEKHGGVDAFKPYIPDIRNAVIAKMAELKSEDVTGNEKREALRGQLKTAIATVLPGALKVQLQDVLYQQFVVQ